MTSVSTAPSVVTQSPPNFSGQKLRGRNFKGHDLSCADFSGADIRGTNFTNAVLRGANFSGAKAGVQKRWMILQWAITFILSLILNYTPLLINTIFAGIIFTPDGKQFEILPGLMLPVVNVIAVCVIARQGFTSKALKNLTLAILTAIIVSGIIRPSIVGVVIIGIPAAVTVAVAATITSAATVTVGGAVSVAVAAIVAFLAAAATSVVFSVAGAFAGKLALTLTIAAAVEVLVLSFYIAWRISKEDDKFALVRSLGIALGSIGGTSFQNADLTDANFNNAILKSTIFTHTKQIRTCWKNAKKLNLSRVGNTILSSLAVRDLLVSGKGNNQSYLYANLQGANLDGAHLNGAKLKGANMSNATLQRSDLQGADLTEIVAISADFTGAYLNGASLESDLSSTRNNKPYLRANFQKANFNGAQLTEVKFKGADLSGATLEEANLQYANLTEALAINTNLMKTDLTGACLESWNIDNTTKLEGVKCCFVFLREYPDDKGNRDRRPHDPEQVFAEGDFEKLYTKMINVVQLLLRRGINREAFAEALTNLMTENPDLSYDSIQSIEKKGEDVLLTLAVPETADKAKIQRDFLQPYEAKVQLLESKVEELQTLHSADLKEIALTLAQNPTQISNQLVGAGNPMNENTSQNVNVGRDMNLSNSMLNLGELSGIVTNTIKQLPDANGTSNLKDLLTQLQIAITDDTSLNDADKAEALEQVKVLAEAGQNPQDGALKKAVNTAIKILKGTIAALPSTTALVKAVTDLLPVITKF